MRCLFYIKDVKGKEPVLYMAVKGCREALYTSLERLTNALWCEGADE